MSGLLILAGPTATGKTTLALELAGLLEGEVVSADSRQVYRELDIGTAKPSPEELRQVRHHLVDVIGVREGYNAGRFAAEAGAAIADIRSRGRTPIICGGTGFYIETLLAPLFDEPVVGAPKKEKVRRQLRERFEHEGPAELHRELARVDPASAERLHPNDFQRISRALELYYFSGRSMTELFGSSRPQPAYESFTVILDLPLDLLEERIRRRTERMFERGWPVEVKRLLAAGVPVRAPGMQSLGYPEVIELVEGKIGREEAFERIVKKTRQYAKRQRTWFRKRAAALRVEPQAAEAETIARRWNEHLIKIEGTGK